MTDCYVLFNGSDEEKFVNQYARKLYYQAYPASGKAKSWSSARSSTQNRFLNQAVNTLLHNLKLAPRKNWRFSGYHGKDAKVLQKAENARIP